MDNNYTNTANPSGTNSVNHGNRSKTGAENRKSGSDKKQGTENRKSNSSENRNQGGCA